jgi:serine/threonine-protein kinase RsbW
MPLPHRFQIGDLLMTTRSGITPIGTPVTSTTALRTIRACYPGRAEQVSAVRAGLAGLLGGCPGADDAILCASELAANAIRHSRSGLPGGHFTVHSAVIPGDCVLIEVEDEGGPWTAVARDPVRRHGLDIVQALAADWGIDGDYHSRAIWVRIENPMTKLHAADSPTDVDATRGSVGRTPDAGRWIATLDGRRLRHLRNLSGLSQESLAAEAGISITTVARLESQPHLSCRSRTLGRLAAALGEHPAALRHHAGS